jgi:transcription elongation factor GreA
MHYLSKERFEELKRELEHLRRERRAEIAERLKKAKEYGDLSENSEYAEAKDEQALVEARIAELDDMLRNVEIIQKSRQKDIVKVGSTVVVEKDGAEFRYTIVGSSEARPEEGRISNESPMGSELIGKKAGDVVTIQTPRGTAEYKLTRIE